MRVDILEFKGKIRPDEFIDWLQIIERILNFKEFSKDGKLKLVALKLKKYASL
jgi:hypothetical protein